MKRAKGLVLALVVALSAMPVGCTTRVEANDVASAEVASSAGLTPIPSTPLPTPEPIKAEATAYVSKANAMPTPKLAAFNPPDGIVRKNMMREDIIRAIGEPDSIRSAATGELLNEGIEYISYNEIECLGFAAQVDYCLFNGMVRDACYVFDIGVENKDEAIRLLLDEYYTGVDAESHFSGYSGSLSTDDDKIHLFFTESNMSSNPDFEGNFHIRWMDMNVELLPASQSALTANIDSSSSVAQADANATAFGTEVSSQHLAWRMPGEPEVITLKINEEGEIGEGNMTMAQYIYQGDSSETFIVCELDWADMVADLDDIADAQEKSDRAYELIEQLSGCKTGTIGPLGNLSVSWMDEEVLEKFGLSDLFASKSGITIGLAPYDQAYLLIVYGATERDYSRDNNSAFFDSVRGEGLTDDVISLFVYGGDRRGIPIR